MSRTLTKATLTTLLAASLLAVSPHSASAQEAIMLEQIGAVRMMTPNEVQRIDASTPRNNETMWFADANTTAYYTLDQGRHELVARFEAGPKGGVPITVRRVLDDGAVESISINGTEGNSIRSTLIITRKADTLSADVTTQAAPDHQASN